jgi:surface-anchored protein
MPLLALAGIGSAPAALFTAGELDFGVKLHDGEFEFEAHVHDGIIDGVEVEEGEFEVAGLTILAGADRRFSAPADLPAAGVLSGDPLWILPQANVPGVPFVALASEELASGDWITPITFTLGTVTSPSGAGTFSMWETDGLGNPTFFFSSTNPGDTDANNQFVSNFGHDHFNWGFSEQGDWQVELTATGTHGTLGELSATDAVSFSVVPEPSSSLLLSLAALAAATRRRRA